MHENIVIIGNKPGFTLKIDDSCVVEKLIITVRGTDNIITIGANTKLCNYIFVENGSQIEIGENVIFNGMTKIHANEGGKCQF